MTVFGQIDARPFGKMKRAHDESRNQSDDSGTSLGAKKQKTTIAQVTERLKRDLQEKLAVFTSQIEPGECQSEVRAKVCGSTQPTVTVTKDEGKECSSPLEVEKNNNSCKTGEYCREKSETEHCSRRASEESRTSNRNSARRTSESNTSCGSAKSCDDGSDETTEGKTSQDGQNREKPKQFKIHNPLGFGNWIQNIQNFMVKCLSPSSFVSE